MGDPLNNPFAQQAIYRHLPSSQGLNPMDNTGGPQAPPSLAPAIPSMPGGVQDPNQAKLWKAIGDQYRRGGPNAGGNPAQFLQNLAHMQPGQRGFATNHAMALASGPQAGQSNLAQNPAAQQQFLQQQSMQRLGLGLPQQQQQQQLGAGGAPGMGGLQHPGLANASQAHLNNLAQSNSPALMSLINNMQNNGMQPGNPLMNNLLRNPNNVLDLHNRNMLEPGMSEQLQAIQRARGNLQPGLAQGGAGAAGQHIRLPSNEHNSPLLSAPHDQNPMGLNRSPQPGNPQHQGMGPQNPQTLALIHKLDSIPVRDLEARVAAWRDNMPNMEARVQELLGAASRPGATPEIGTAYARAKNDLDQNKFLFIKAQEILNRKHVQAQTQMAQAQAQAQAQAHAQAQAAARMTPTIGEQNRPGSRAAGGLPGQAPGMPGWQPQPGPSSTPQLSQGSPPGTSSTPFQPVPSPQPNAEQQNQQATPAFRQPGQRQTAIPRDRAAFVHFIRLWFVQTGRNVDAIPKIGDKPLDLHQLYIEVETLGGPEKVQATGLWRLVAVKMGYVTHEQNDPQLAQIAKVLADTYVALLVPFDNFCLERMRAVGNGIQTGRLNQGMNPQIGMAPTPAVPAGLRTAPGGILPGDGANPLSMANFQRVLAFLQVTLKDWMPEAPPQTKLLRASQMDVPAMQREGWPTERISVVQRFRPALLQFRATFLRQQQMHQQALSQQGMQQQNAQAQAQQQQANAQQQQQHVNDHRSSSGGGSLPPNMQAHNIHGLPGAAGTVKLPFPPEVTERAKMIVSNMAREIEQTRQYQHREVPEHQRVAMNSSVVTAHPFAVEFERTVSLHFMLLNNQQQTRNLMEQAALLREQHRILQNGQQQYIMTLEEVQAVQNSLRLAIHNLKTTYAAKVKQHQEHMANLRAAEAGGQLGQQQTVQQVQQVQQRMLQQHPQQQQQALAAMSFLNANAGLSGNQPPQLVQQRPPSQPQYGSPKPDPGKAPQGLTPQMAKAAAPSMSVKQRKPAAPGQPISTPSPAAAPTPNMESAPTPSSANEPATPKSPKNKAKAIPPAVKRTPTQQPKKKQSMKIELPPPNLGFPQQSSNKRQREDEVPPAAEPVIPIAGPSSPKRMKTDLESVAPIKLEHSNDDPLESMEEALAGLQNVAPGPGGDGIDQDILAQLSEILDGAGGVAGASGSAQPPSLDQPPDASGPKVEDVFDFSYYLNDTLGDDDPLGGALEADTPDLNTNKETPDSAADDIEHLGKSPGKGEMPAGIGGKDLAGSRAPTLTEGFWEAFDDGEMAEGAYYAGGGANGFNWSGPIEPNASWIGITGTAA